MPTEGDVHEEKPRRGIDVGHVLVGLFLLLLVGAVATPRVIEARKRGNEASAISGLKSIRDAESVFREGDKEHDGNLDYGMLSELSTAGLVDPDLGAGTRKGYRFQATYSFHTSEFLWFAVANPESPGFTGDRYFAVNQTGVIGYATGARLVLDTDTCFLQNQGIIVSDHD